MDSTETRWRVLITCRSCKLVIWSAPVVVNSTTSSGTTATGERKEWLDELPDSNLFGNARTVLDEHRARHMLRDGWGPKIDVQCLPDQGQRGEEVSA